MQVSITGRHMQVSGETKEFIEDRINRFLHYFDRVTSVQMTAIHDHDDVVIEFVIHAARGDTFVVKERKGIQIFMPRSIGRPVKSSASWSSSRKRLTITGPANRSLHWRRCSQKMMN